MNTPSTSPRRSGAEYTARLFVLGVLIGLPLAALLPRVPLFVPGGERVVEIHGQMAESGGWTPGELSATVGEPLRLRLTSDDVMHGFAIGQSDWPALDVKPGEMTETTLTFDRPGKYTFYCTRWCGPNHWRMRGTIEVTGAPNPSESSQPPLYSRLGLDLDAPHPAGVLPAVRPSADRGEALGASVPAELLSADYYRSHSPAEAWQDLSDSSQRSESPGELSDAEVWDLVAFVWRSSTTGEGIEEGRRLFAENCAACHGETGAGDGVMASALEAEPASEFSRDLAAPADFTDSARMLGASPAVVQGKIIRGGMGTGMPYWGPIFTETQTWALVGYLWTFQFDGLTP